MRSGGQQHCRSGQCRASTASRCLHRRLHLSHSPERHGASLRLRQREGGKEGAVGGHKSFDSQRRKISAPRPIAGRTRRLPARRFLDAGPRSMASPPAVLHARPCSSASSAVSRVPAGGAEGGRHSGLTGEAGGGKGSAHAGSGGPTRAAGRASVAGGLDRAPPLDPPATSASVRSISTCERVASPKPMRRTRLSSAGRMDQALSVGSAQEVHRRRCRPWPQGWGKLLECC